jgi:hypothetical protein
VGVSIAVETAAVAAEVLLDCLAADDFGKARLDTIQSRREPAVREVHRRQLQLGRGIGSGAARSRRAVALALPWLARLGLAQRFVRPLVVGEPLGLGS